MKNEQMKNEQSKIRFALCSSIFHFSLFLFHFSHSVSSVGMNWVLGHTFLIELGFTSLIVICY